MRRDLDTQVPRRASSTIASNSFCCSGSDAALSSGCHCTAISQGWLGISIASMVPGRGVELVTPEDFCQLRSGFEFYPVRDRFARRSAVQHFLAELVRNVLDQLAALDHVQDLGAAADAERGHAGVDHAPAQFQFERVALLIDGVV